MQGRRRSPARLIAPVALLLAVVAVLLVIQSTLGSDDSDGGDSNGSQAERTTTTETREQPVRQRANYTVKLNDTLGLIAEKTGVSVERIQVLNPDLDPQNLIVGQKIKLRE